MSNGKNLRKNAFLPVLMLAVLGAVLERRAIAAPPSGSKLSIHLDMAYTGGAQAVISAHPRVLKIMFSCACVSAPQLQAAADYKAGTPSGKVVLRIYSAQRLHVTDDPTAAATSFWNNSMAPAINNLSPAQKALIDYLEGPNEGDSTPTFEDLTHAQWFNTFWLQLAQHIADAGMKPMMGSIAVGNPAGSSEADMYSMIDAIVPALRKCKSLGGGWSYHGYSGPAMTKDLNTEIWYSLRYRKYYDRFRVTAPDLLDLPLVGSEGGGFTGWKQVGAAYFQDWLVWHDAQIRQDAYFIGDTLFEIGDPNGWGDFDLEPIAGWLATYIASQASTGPPTTPTSLSTVAGDTSVSLSWNGSTGAETYSVKRSTTSGGPYALVIGNLTTTSYTNVGLTNWTTYYYVVSASNVFGESAYSAQVSATPMAGAMNGNTPGGSNFAPSWAQWATDSNYSSSFDGAKAIDGVTSSTSKWTSNGSAPPHWLALDLGRDLAVNGYIVRHASAGDEPASYNTKNFRIQSADSMNGPWMDETVVDNTAQAGVTTRSYYVPQTLRYVRLYITNAGTDNYARIPEFEVWATLPTYPELKLSTTGLTASCTVGTNPSNQSFTIRNSGTGTLNYTLSDDAAWLAASPASGASTGEADTITISFSAAALTAGDYTATITLTAPGATNTPQTLPVHLTVTPPHVRPDFDADGDVDQEDFGHFQICFSELAVPQNLPNCQDAKLDNGTYVGPDDLLIFEQCFTGPGVIPALNCAD